MPRMTLEERIQMSLQRTTAQLFLRKDFNKFGGYDQVGRALRAVIDKGRLVKAGYGIYVKARPSSLTGNPVPVMPLIEIGISTLKKLGASPELGGLAKEYLGGGTTQMPMATVLNIGKSRISRKIGFGAKSIRYEP